MVVLLLHGGAGTIPELERKQMANKAIVEILNEVYPMLSGGGSALDAVQKAVELMENSPLFNAGMGSVMTSEETIEMDALLMDGKSMGIGGVIGVSKIKNPIILSRKVLESNKHVLYFGEGAEKFAMKHGIELIDPNSLITERIRERFANFKLKNQVDKRDPEGREKYGTVGAVALDCDGNLAAATSTGGVLGKEIGRVGDTPIIGAGTYADDTIACSATGVGEYIIKSMLSIRIKFLIEQGKSVQQATTEALEYAKKISGPAGIIVLGKNGEWVADKNTKDLVYAIKTANMTKSFMDDM